MSDGYWKAILVGRTYRDDVTLAGRVHGETLHYQMEWHEPDGGDFFWLGKEGVRTPRDDGFAPSPVGSWCGCFCPPGSEKTCQGKFCPRKAIDFRAIGPSR